MAEHADVEQFRALFSKTSDVDKTLKTALRKGIRLAAERAADDSRRTIDGGTASGTGLRMAIASGIRVSVMTGNTAGIRITAGTSQMPEGKRAMVRAMDKPSFRHPIYGSGRWAQQAGRPYFGSVITGHSDSVTAAVEDAMREALKSITN